MGQILNHDFQLNKLSIETQTIIKSKIYRELPVNHRQIVIQTAKRIIEKYSAMNDIYMLDIDVPNDLSFMSDCASYYAADYLLKNNFKVEDKYAHLVDELCSNIGSNISNNLVSKYQNIMHISSQQSSVFGGNGRLNSVGQRSRDDVNELLNLANKIKQSLSIENYIRLLEMFIISMAHEDDVSD